MVAFGERIRVEKNGWWWAGVGISSRYSDAEIVAFYTPILFIIIMTCAIYTICWKMVKLNDGLTDFKRISVTLISKFIPLGFHSIAPCPCHKQASLGRSPCQVMHLLGLSQASSRLFSGTAFNLWIKEVYQLATAAYQVSRCWVTEKQQLAVILAESPGLAWSQLGLWMYLWLADQLSSRSRMTWAVWQYGFRFHLSCSSSMLD